MSVHGRCTNDCTVIDKSVDPDENGEEKVDDCQHNRSRVPLGPTSTTLIRTSLPSIPSQPSITNTRSALQQT